MELGVEVNSRGTHGAQSCSLVVFAVAGGGGGGVAEGTVTRTGRAARRDLDCDLPQLSFIHSSCPISLGISNF